MNQSDRDHHTHACLALCALDPALARAHDYIGVPAWRVSVCEYQSLARTVTYQLISTRAADVIWERVCTWAGGEVTAGKVLAADFDDLRACGLSGPKVRHMVSIAEAVTSGALPLDKISSLTDKEARKLLIAVKGIGPWTAELFLMCSLQRMDAFPEGDVGLMESYRLLSDAETRLNAKAFQIRAESWRPYRGMAAHLLWGYLNQKRSEAL
jgi:DNA-3-methyladenine glycosylase II